MPLLLAFITFSYFASELWQSVGRLDSWAFLGITGLFVGLSAIFLASRHHLDLADLSSFQTREEWADALRRATGDPAPRLPFERANAVATVVLGDIVGQFADSPGRADPSAGRASR